jgi:hypothetical protein
VPSSADGAFCEGGSHDSLVVIAVIIRLLTCRGGVGWHAQELTATRQFLVSIAVAEEAVVADASEANWRYVEQEPSDKLVGGEGHGAVTVTVSIVLPAEANLIVVEGDEAIVRDGNAVRVATNVV